VDEALAAFAEVLKLNPRAVIAYVQVGQLNLALGHSKAALSAVSGPMNRMKVSSVSTKADHWGRLRRYRVSRTCRG
jgi:hypothetical protein